MNISSIISKILSGLESTAATMVMGVLAVFIPKLLTVSERDFEVIAANFQKFMSDIIGGRPIGEALAGMLTADWNEVEADAKEIATDFADAVGTALSQIGLAKS